MRILQDQVTFSWFLSGLFENAQAGWINMEGVLGPGFNWFQLILIGFDWFQLVSFGFNWF